MASDQVIINQCKDWLAEIIIGLNFCPFAKKEYVNNSIAYPIVHNVNMKAALEQLIIQCEYLDEHPEVSTSLVIFPDNFKTFDQYLDLVDLAEPLVFSQGYEGKYQIATFHPDYCFQGAAHSEVSNFTNRSPYPMLHIIREDDLTRAVELHPDPEGIPDRNIALCDKKGEQFFLDVLKRIKSES